MTVLSSGIHTILVHVLLKYTRLFLVALHITVHSGQGHFMWQQAEQWSVLFWFLMSRGSRNFSSLHCC